ncbi:MAG TPA: DNA-directed RNA polymerase subunit omega [Candidatus Monoglobus merdigallinarum]|uniref:DNA-directed RNA polymerase subunit omega n=1 Tax=Candidatus Monoglobus merdigallinarum TaxID=2838698 RepID=A0A9D1PQZ0_9FIRM|nr:DNA-directed RNA polymerase subunit omega [Candidatus Monoglobus merdigallinarum]
MMIKPPITELVEKTGNRYLLTIETAKRARQLTEGKQPVISTDASKEVSIAAEEIYEDKLNYIHTPDIGTI